MLPGPAPAGALARAALAVFVALMQLVALGLDHVQALARSRAVAAHRAGRWEVAGAARAGVAARVCWGDRELVRARIGAVPLPRHRPAAAPGPWACLVGAAAARLDLDSRLARAVAEPARTAAPPLPAAAAVAVSPAVAVGRASDRRLASRPALLPQMKMPEVTMTARDWFAGPELRTLPLRPRRAAPGAGARAGQPRVVTPEEVQPGPFAAARFEAASVRNWGPHPALASALPRSTGAVPLDRRAAPAALVWPAAAGLLWHARTSTPGRATPGPPCSCRHRRWPPARWRR